MSPLFIESVDQKVQKRPEKAHKVVIQDSGEAKQQLREPISVEISPVRSHSKQPHPHRSQHAEKGYGLRKDITR
jgi:hypothetical protein